MSMVASVPSYLSYVHVNSTSLLVLGEEDVHGGLCEGGEANIKLLGLPDVPGLGLWRCLCKSISISLLLTTEAF